MKKFFVILGLAFVCITAFANTIEWYVDGSLYQTTTCNSGDSIIPPTAPEKYGYHFDKWTAGYTQLEYIESTGTQYIDTGYIANGGMAIEAKAAPGGTSDAYSFWIGSIGPITENPDNTRNAIASNGAVMSWQKGRAYNGATFSLSNNNPVVVYMNTIGNAFEGKANGTTINVNPTSIQLTLTGLTTTVKIGYSDYSGAARAMTIYYFKMWNNNYELIQNLIPAKRNSDNAIGMYDTVSEQFFTNAGMGEFIAGPEVGGL